MSTQMTVVRAGEIALQIAHLRADRLAQMLDSGHQPDIWKSISRRLEIKEEEARAFFARVVIPQIVGNLFDGDCLGLKGVGNDPSNNEHFGAIALKIHQNRRFELDPKSDFLSRGMVGITSEECTEYYTQHILPILIAKSAGWKGCVITRTK